ncbi:MULTISPECIES: acyltransferase domain-containing protein [Pseudomonas]
MSPSTSTPCVFMFPGQGSDPSGSLLNLYRTGADTRRCIDDVFTAVEAGFSCLEPDAGIHFGELHRLLLTKSHPASLPYGLNPFGQFVASVSLFQVLGTLGLRPHALVGHSLGEIAATVCAGSFDIAQGLQAVNALNHACRELQGRGAMVWVAASAQDTHRLIEDSGLQELAIACINTANQTVVSGPNPAIDALLALVGTNLPRRHKLDLPYMSHHPALNREAEQFYQTLGQLPQHPLALPVYSCVARRFYCDEDDLKRGFANCLTHPTYFPEVLDQPLIRQASLYVNVGPGDTLARCVRTVQTHATSLAPLTQTPEQLNETITFLRGAQ